MRKKLTEEEIKQRQREACKRYRLRNLEKCRAKDRARVFTPEEREHRRLHEAQWRKDNPEVLKQRRKEWYEKNKERIREAKNEKAKQKYKTDEQHRRKLAEYHAKRYQLNRKKFCVVCNQDLPRNRAKYCDNCQAAEYAKKTKACQERLGKDHINRLQNIKVKRKVDALTDGYIVSQLRGVKYPGIRKEDFPPEMIETKRSLLKLKRELKNLQQ